MDRKKDAREKIQLGGLVVKAGLRDTDKAIILGILADAAKRLSDSSERDRWLAIGKAAFKDDTQTRDADLDPDSSDVIGSMGNDGD